MLTGTGMRTILMRIDKLEAPSRSQSTIYASNNGTISAISLTAGVTHADTDSGGNSAFANRC
jgi:hypothetical protein